MVIYYCYPPGIEHMRPGIQILVSRELYPRIDRGRKRINKCRVNKNRAIIFGRWLPVQASKNVSPKCLGAILRARALTLFNHDLELCILESQSRRSLEQRLIQMVMAYAMVELHAIGRPPQCGVACRHAPRRRATESCQEHQVCFAGLRTTRLTTGYLVSKPH